jgi:aldehyde:ferredoxin oxidoreductase
MLAGERRINMMRVFNAREGFTKKDDRLPARFFEPLPNGPSKGRSIDETDFNAAVKLYYQIAGWDEDTGNPREGTLKRLSLGWILERKPKLHNKENV